MPSISRDWRRGASAILLLSGCARAAQPGRAPIPASSGGPFPLAQVFVLEAAGILPDDTTITVPRGKRRVVVLRRSAPDFGLFARMEFDDSALVAPGDSVRIAIHPLPGEYALDLSMTGTIQAGARVIFSYGSHFLAPAGARERYGSDLQFGQALAIGRIENGLVVFLPTSRPGTDMVSATLPGPGRYLVGAPK